MWTRLKIVLGISMALVAAIGLLSPTLSTALLLLTLWGLAFVASIVLYVLKDEGSRES